MSDAKPHAVAASPRWRRWLQFRLRTLFLLVALAAFGLKAPPGCLDLEGYTPDDALQILGGVKTLRHLAIGTVGSDDLQHLEALTHLESLVLRHRRIDDDIVARVGELKSLRRLTIPEATQEQKERLRSLLPNSVVE